ncbi:type IV pilin protein [Oceanobacter mangrovi]|uniref:type IV pilin protein n=1 Tax=Oceanobacter mangrovi TaxID=2862510 RepID=UPI001C8E6DEB|nr:type IV pilin protein [Oceanobacter mangrovi]
MSFARLTRTKGFSLIELMAVLAILGVLSVIVIPSYQNHIQKAYRSEAIQEITQVLQAQERYYSNNMTYTKDLTKLGYTSTYKVADDRYTITAVACDSGATLTQCIQIEATASTEQADDGDLMADSIGNQTRTVGGDTYDW